MNALEDRNNRIIEAVQQKEKLPLLMKELTLCFQKTAGGFEMILKTYLQEYEKAGLKANRFTDIDAFIYAYLEDGKEVHAGK